MESLSAWARFPKTPPFCTGVADAVAPMLMAARAFFRAAIALGGRDGMVIWNPKFVSGSASNRFIMAGFVGSASSAAGGRLCGAGGKTALTGCAAGSLSGASSAAGSFSTSVSAAATGRASSSSALLSGDASSYCGTSARCDSSSSPAAWSAASVAAGSGISLLRRSNSSTIFSICVEIGS